VRVFAFAAFAVALSFAIASVVPAPRAAFAFGDVGAFDPRVLITGSQTGPAHTTAPARWAWELVQRTSAPARLQPAIVHADDPAVVTEPFLYWSGDSEVDPLTAPEIAGLRRFFGLGGVLLVDDAMPGEQGEPSAFGRSTRRELARVLADSTRIAIGADHVIFRTFYLLNRAQGRVQGPATLEAIVRGAQVQVLFSEHDIGGALARSLSGTWEQRVLPGGEVQREHAIRLAVNVAMYVLCSNYKDDQVHAPYLMRRRAAATP